MPPGLAYSRHNTPRRQMLTQFCVVTRILCAIKLSEGSAPRRRSAEQNPLIASHSQEHTPHRNTRYKGYTRRKLRQHEVLWQCDVMCWWWCACVCMCVLAGSLSCCIHAVVERATCKCSKIPWCTRLTHHQWQSFERSPQSTQPHWQEEYISRGRLIVILVDSIEWCPSPRSSSSSSFV